MSALYWICFAFLAFAQSKDEKAWNVNSLATLSNSDESEQGVDLNQILTRMQFLERKLVNQEMEIMDLKEKYDVDIQEIRKKFENEVADLKRRHTDDITAIYKHLDTTRLHRAIMEDDGTEESDDDNEDDVLDVETPAADEEKPVDTVDEEEDHARRSIGAGLMNQRRRQLEDDENISFFAKIVTNVHHLGQNQNVIFENVVTNNGNAYNPYMGAFIAPFGGTYTFSTTLVTFNNDTSHYGIFLNDERITILYVNGADNNSDSAAQTVILQLQENDTVSVRHLDSDRSLVGYHHSLFSGALIAQDYSGTASIVGK